jgi:hypothetical protein
MTNESIHLTSEELKLIADVEFFHAKARIMVKVHGMLDDLYVGLQQDLRDVDLLAPATFNRKKFQFVKGEHLEECPYQYLDYPKHFEGDEKFTFRSLFWWGHHMVFALILEGPGLLRYKQNLINRYHLVAGRGLDLSLSPSPWEWKRGEGYTMPLTHDRKSQVSAVLSERRFFKLSRFVPYEDGAIFKGGLVEVGRASLRSMLPVISP